MLPGLSLFEVISQIPKQFYGRRCIHVDPAVIDLSYWYRIQVVPAKSSLLLHDHQIGPFEHAQMLHHGAAIKVRKVPANVAGRFWFVSDQVKDLATTPIRKGLVDQVVVLFS